MHDTEVSRILLIKRGQITKNSNGKIDMEKADRDWERNSKLTLVKAQQAKSNKDKDILDKILANQEKMLQMMKTMLINQITN